MKKLVVLLTLFVALLGPAQADEFPLFDHLKSLDGKSYAGALSFTNKEDDPMDKPMRMTVKVVSEEEVRIPFHVGEDKSRTWILTRTSDGLQLKHDHRHEDGTPDDLTNYGGTAQPSGLGNLIIFPADAETIEMLPEAASNHWSFRLSPCKTKLFYYLERHAEPRFEAGFDLSKEIE